MDTTLKLTTMVVFILVGSTVFSTQATVCDRERQRSNGAHRSAFGRRRKSEQYGPEDHEN